eukprot:14871706-Heterocapsa_arctica.AAC.1
MPVASQPGTRRSDFQGARIPPMQFMLSASLRALASGRPTSRSTCSCSGIPAGAAPGQPPGGVASS